jgi:hypothetical protein
MDIVGAAETGSGKTLAFGIPIVQGILQDRRREAEELRQSEDAASTTEGAPQDSHNLPEEKKGWSNYSGFVVSLFLLAFCIE